MALIDFTSQKPKDTYQYLMQISASEVGTGLGTAVKNVVAITSSRAITASYALNGSELFTASFYQVTASWAQNMIFVTQSIFTSSYATSASFASRSITASFLTPGTYAVTSSTSKTASYLLGNFVSNTGSVAGRLSLGTVTGGLTSQMTIWSDGGQAFQIWNTSNPYLIMDISLPDTFNPVLTLDSNNSAYTITLNPTGSSNFRTQGDVSFSTNISSSGGIHSSGSILTNSDLLIYGYGQGGGGAVQTLVMSNESWTSDRSFTLGFNNWMGGVANTDSIIIGSNNSSSNFVGAVVGVLNNVVGGEDTNIFGESNTAGNACQIFGYGNILNTAHTNTSTVVGIANNLYTGSNSFIVGKDNILNNVGYSGGILGCNITNTVADTIDIGLSDASKMTMTLSGSIFRKTIVGTSITASRLKGTASWADNAGSANYASSIGASSFPAFLLTPTAGTQIAMVGHIDTDTSIYGSNILVDTNAGLTASNMTATNFVGTASWANKAVSASWAPAAAAGTTLFTASLYQITASYALSASRAISASWAPQVLFTASLYQITASQALSSSYVLTASYVIPIVGSNGFLSFRINNAITTVGNQWVTIGTIPLTAGSTYGINGALVGTFTDYGATGDKAVLSANSVSPVSCSVGGTVWPNTDADSAAVNNVYGIKANILMNASMRYIGSGGNLLIQVSTDNIYTGSFGWTGTIQTII